ncbi:MAG: DUF429 domain-containing protein [Gemmatimonadales bacterium]
MRPDRLPDASACLAGIDGCRSGWLMVTAEGRRWRASVASSVAELLASARPAVAAIDMPIGLLERGDRPADRELRLLLGPRKSSVFPAPLRGTLHAATHRAACEARRRIDGKGYSLQSFHLFPKIRELDALVRRIGQRRSRLVESHPESAFAVMAGAPLRHSKRTAAGRLERRRLLATKVPGAGSLIAAGPPGGASWDDLLDAVALVWVARRIRAGRARAFPRRSPPADPHGIVPRVLI